MIISVENSNSGVAYSSRVILFSEDSVSRNPTLKVEIDCAISGVSSWYSVGY